MDIGSIPLMVGGVFLPALVAGLISAYSHFVHPLTENQAKLLNGAGAVIAFTVVVFYNQYPDLQEVIEGIVIAIWMFLSTIGFYEEAKKINPRFTTRKEF